MMVDENKGVASAALTPSAGEAEPVAWQHRIRPNFAISEWSPWLDGRAPQLRTDNYEAEERPLFASPSASEAQVRVKTAELQRIAYEISALKLHPATSEEFDAGYIAARNDAFAIVQEVIDNLPGEPKPEPGLSIEEQKAQAKRCNCHGADDYCPCQNVPDAETRRERALSTPEHNTRGYAERAAGLVKRAPPDFADKDQHIEWGGDAFVLLEEIATLSTPEQGETEAVWQDVVAPTLDERMKAAGMFTIEEMMGVTPLTKWKVQVGMTDLEFFSEWLDRKVSEYLSMKAAYDLGDKDESDELYEWVLAHAGAYSSIRENFRAARALSSAATEDGR